MPNVKTAPEVSSPTILIVGAASGAGLACAQTLAGAGARLILADCDGVELAKVARRLDAQSRFCDATGRSSVEIFAADITALVPSIDVLVNAAGSAYLRPLATMLVTEALLPLLRKAEGQRLIVNVASGSATAQIARIFPYATSMDAFRGITASLQERVRGSGIRVVSMIPAGPVAVSDDCGSAPAPFFPDAASIARQVLALVLGTRPDWSPNELPIPRRA